jgi:hypothetical protein
MMVCMTTTAGGRGRAVSRSTPLSPPPLSQQETIEDLLVRSKRDFVPIRKTFVQIGRGKATQPGPLSTFVSTHDERGLDAYLIVHALASAEPWNCDYPSGTWVRALDLLSDAEPASARSAVSKVMHRLEERGLVSRGRAGRNASITLLREDGSGEPYDHPHSRGETWLQLPTSTGPRSSTRRSACRPRLCCWSPSASPTTSHCPPSVVPSGSASRLTAPSEDCGSWSTRASWTTARTG